MDENKNMVKRIEDQDGLTPEEAKACLYRAQGLSQSDAYRRAFNKPQAKPKTINEKACRLFAKPATQARVSELLKASKVQDIISVGEWGQMVLEGVEKARADNNMTAFFNGTRQLGQAVGALKDNVALTVEQRTDDDTLIEQFAGGDPAKLAVLRTMLGAKDTFDA